MLVYGMNGYDIMNMKIDKSNEKWRLFLYK